MRKMHTLAISLAAWMRACGFAPSRRPISRVWASHALLGLLTTGSLSCSVEAEEASNLAQSKHGYCPSRPQGCSLLPPPSLYQSRFLDVPAPGNVTHLALVVLGGEGCIYDGVHQCQKKFQAHRGPVVLPAAPVDQSNCNSRSARGLPRCERFDLQRDFAEPLPVSAHHFSVLVMGMVAPADGAGSNINELRGAPVLTYTVFEVETGHGGSIGQRIPHDLNPEPYACANSLCRVLDPEVPYQNNGNGGLRFRRYGEWLAQLPQESSVVCPQSDGSEGTILTVYKSNLNAEGLVSTQPPGGPLMPGSRLSCGEDLLVVRGGGRETKISTGTEIAAASGVSTGVEVSVASGGEQPTQYAGCTVSPALRTFCSGAPNLFLE